MIFLIDRKLLTSLVMKQYINILLSIVILLGPALTHAHNGHKHIIIKAQLSLCSVNCEDESHNHSLPGCDSEFQLTRYLAYINITQPTSIEPDVLFSILSFNRVSSRSLYSCPQGRAPPFST